MKLFSRSLAGFARWAAPALLAMAAVALLRFVLAPVLGVTSGPAEKLISLTTVWLVALVVYGVLLGLGEGRIGDVVVIGFSLTLAMTVLLGVLLPLSSALGVANAFLDPAHVGKDTPLGHAFRHVKVIPFQTLFASIVCGLVFGLTRLGRMIKKRMATNS